MRTTVGLTLACLTWALVQHPCLASDDEGGHWQISHTQTCSAQRIRDGRAEDINQWSGGPNCFSEGQWVCEWVNGMPDNWSDQFVLVADVVIRADWVPSSDNPSEPPPRKTSFLIQPSAITNVIPIERDGDTNRCSYSMSVDDGLGDPGDQDDDCHMVSQGRHIVTLDTTSGHVTFPLKMSCNDLVNGVERMGAYVSSYLTVLAQTDYHMVSITAPTTYHKGPNNEPVANVWQDGSLRCDVGLEISTVTDEPPLPEVPPDDGVAWQTVGYTASIQPSGAFDSRDKYNWYSSLTDRSAHGDYYYTLDRSIGGFSVPYMRPIGLYAVKTNEWSLKNPGATGKQDHIHISYTFGSVGVAATDNMYTYLHLPEESSLLLDQPDLVATPDMYQPLPGAVDIARDINGVKVTVTDDPFVRISQGAVAVISPLLPVQAQVVMALAGLAINQFQSETTVDNPYNNDDACWNKAVEDTLSGVSLDINPPALAVKTLRNGDKGDGNHRSCRWTVKRAVLYDRKYYQRDLYGANGFSGIDLLETDVKRSAVWKITYQGEDPK